MRTPITSVGLFVNCSKPEPVAMAARLIPFLRAHAVTPLFSKAVAATMQGETGIKSDAVLDADLIVVLGGDGTALAAARALCGRSRAMLTVRFGSFGFLAEVEPEFTESALERVLAGEYSIEERPMLRARRQRGGETTHDVVGLNDVALVRGQSPRLVKLEARVNGEPLAVYSGDGVVVSTATGSTAYSLAAGGPIVHPTLDALLVTPICPHALHFRPLLIPPDSALTLQIPESGGEAQVSVDGQVTFDLELGDIITVCQSSCRARFVTLGESSFYQKVRTRLRWGERLL
jgi:NAD+ kinase